MKVINYSQFDFCITGIITLFFVGILSFPITGQNMASFDEELGISVKSVEGEMRINYEIQVDETMKRYLTPGFFKRFNNDLVIAVYDNNQEKLIFNLAKRKQPEWKTQDWNDYLAKTYYEFMNQKNE